MIRNLCKNNWQLILLNSLVVVLFILGYGRFGDVIVDSFREAYIPEQILNGQVPYKNIFVIYPPFAYLFNSLLFLIFGVHLKVLYFSGLMSTITIINLVYIISSYFLKKPESFCITLLFIGTSVLSPNVFNTFFPYSYGILYGLLFCLSSILFTLKQKYSFAYLLCALAICAKFEFIFFLPILIWHTKKENYLKNIIAFTVPFLILLAVLFAIGANISDLILSLNLISKVASAKTLEWFYSVTGIIFRPEIIPIYLINFIKFIVPVILLYYWKNLFSIVISFIFLYFVTSPEIFVYVFPLIALILIFRYKTLNKNELFIILASIMVSLKVFFALTLQSYGIFYIPFAIISTFILTSTQYRKSLTTVITIVALICGINNSLKLIKKNVPIKTERGIVYSIDYYGKTLANINSYIIKNTNENDTILILPESLCPNFMTNRISDNKFYSLIPLYTETYGEDLIIERLKRTAPKYIIITNYDTSNYYFYGFGYDYATKITKYIQQEYNLDEEITDGLNASIYKKKTTHPSQ